MTNLDTRTGSLSPHHKVKLYAPAAQSATLYEAGTGQQTRRYIHCLENKEFSMRWTEMETV